jgi:hypothetical protein
VELCVHADPDAEDEVPPVEAFEGAATEVRQRTLPTPFVALVDRRHTCFAPHAASINQYGVLVEDFTMTYVFHWFFQTCLWEIWEQLYSTRRTEPPITYAGVRELVRDVGPVVDRGARPWAHVVGYRTETREPVDLRGEIIDVVYTGRAHGEGTPPLAQLAGQVTLVLETGDGTVTVGGWGAVVEDVEATRLTLERVEEP